MGVDTWKHPHTPTHTHTLEQMKAVHLYIVMSHIVFVVKMKERQLPITGELNLGSPLQVRWRCAEISRWVERNVHRPRAWRMDMSREQNGTSII